MDSKTDIYKKGLTDMEKYNRFDLIDSLELIADTVFLEASGEGYEGQLAVAYVIMNRVRKRRRTPQQIILQPYQFSCWNDDYITMANQRLDRATKTIYVQCMKAACCAFFRLAEDPTMGADHYLNQSVVMNTQGKLPSWVFKLQYTTQIGNHWFYKS